MKPPKVSLKAIEQEFDLSEFAPEVDFSSEQSLKAQIGQAIIDKITDRTESGHGIGGVKLKSPYSKAYQHSLAFKAAGKKPTKVNMELTGDMVASVNIVKDDGDSKITIGIEDESQVPKAYNHITGDTVPRRPWFGLTKSEMKAIIGQFKTEIEKAASDPGKSDQNPATSSKLTMLDLLDEGD